MTSFPSSIKAATFAKIGGPEVIEITDQSFPAVYPTDVLVKVEYGGVNFIDTYFRSGLYPIKSFPYTIGGEGSGVVVKLPSDPTVLQSEVFKKSGLKEGARVAWRQPGSFSQYLAVPWHLTAVLPEGIETKIGAAVIVQGLTALTFMTEAHDVKKGETILVHTVAGGLGLLFAQIAHARGACVIGTTSTPEKVALARAHGADDVILYKSEDTVARVLELTNGEGVDAIFDGVGKDTFEGDLKMIKRKGTIVCVGNASGAVPPFAPLRLMEKNVKLLRPTVANYVVTPEEVSHYAHGLFELVKNGTIKVNVHDLYPFTAEGVQQAQKDLVGGKTTGKLVVKIGNN